MVGVWDLKVWTDLRREQETNRRLRARAKRHKGEIETYQAQEEERPQPTVQEPPGNTQRWQEEQFWNQFSVNSKLLA